MLLLELTDACLFLWLLMQLPLSSPPHMCLIVELFIFNQMNDE
jgi:hypothetical protein